jgi:hypothetical protein
MLADYIRFSNMRINLVELDQMFETADLSKEELYNALRKMGPKAIRPAFRGGWSESNPVWCTCYFVSEFAYFYLAPKGTKAYSVKVPGDPGTHRFLMWPDGRIVDLTAEQFPNYELVKSVYPNAKVTAFMQTGCKGPSVRAKELAGHLGYNLATWKKP